MTFSMLLQNKPVADLVPTMGVFVAAAFRMIPSINRIMAAIQKIGLHYHIIINKINMQSTALNNFVRVTTSGVKAKESKGNLF